MLYDSVKALLADQDRNIKKIIRLVSDSVALTQKINEQIGPLVMGLFQPVKQINSLENTIKHIRNSAFNIAKFEGEMKGLVLQKQQEANKIHYKIMRLQKQDAYKL